MGLIAGYSFDNAANFTLTNTEIESNKARLKRVPNPGVTFSEDFADDTGFTYNSAEADFIAGELLTKDVTPANSVLHGNLISAINLNWRKDAGALTGTLRNTPITSSSGLICTGSQGLEWSGLSSEVETLVVKYVPNYTGAPPENLNIISTSGASNNDHDRFNLTHSPSGDNFRITVRDKLGNLLVNASTIGASAINLQAGTVYFLAVVLDAVTKRVILYTKAGAGAWTLHGTYTSALGGWTRGGISLKYKVGADSSVYDRAEGTFSSFSKFSAAMVPTTTPITDPMPEYIYPSTKIDGPYFSYSGIGTVQSLDNGTISETGAFRYIVALRYWDGAEWSISNGSYQQANDFSTIVAHLSEINLTGGGGILPWSVVSEQSNVQSTVDSFEIEVTGEKYATTGTIKPVHPLSVKDFISYSHDAVNTANTDSNVILETDGVKKYFDGANWVDSNGTLAQSNTEAEMAANIASYSFGENVTAYPIWILETSVETETPQLNSASIGYNYGLVASSPATCNVVGYLRDVGGNPVANATLSFKISGPSKRYHEASNNIVSPLPLTTTTNSDGYFSISLVRSSEFQNFGTYVMEIQYDNSTTVTKSSTGKLIFDVPDAEYKDITELLPTAE